MKILAVETSAVAASAALCNDGFITGEFYTNTKMTHSQTLMPMVESLLKCSKTAIGDVDLFAVSSGPGSFTGVRIGVAAVKGMASAYNAPCAAVSTLETIAMNAAGFGGVACAVMDARCGQVYNALFDVSSGLPRRMTEDRAISIEQLKNEITEIKKRMILVGDGAKLCYNKLNDCEYVTMAQENLLYQRASATAALAYEMWKREELVSADELRPFYLRLPQAERELKKKTEECKIGK